MADSNLAVIIFLVLLPLICIILVLVPIMFISSKLFSSLISPSEDCKMHLIGSIGFLLWSIGLFLLYNYQHQNYLFYFSTWQIFTIILFAIIGSGVTYEYKNKLLKQILSVPTTIILLSVVVALWGLDAIKTQQAYFKYVHFQGGEAIYIGILYIVLAMLLMLLAIHLYIKRNKKS